ncbi:MAG TPA: FAD:protein FMN transferase [Solirubrobacteraceae bacterium]|nr:FAD:protein FMN transferase [Solirubrobacteraceae bacterium]
MSGAPEAVERFECFGSRCGVLVAGARADGRSARAAAELARLALLGWHERFSRFLPESELSRLNADPAETIAVSPLMARLAAATRAAGERTRGLVDATLLGAIERAGYDSRMEGRVEPPPLALLLELAPARAVASPSPAASWRAIEVDVAAGVLTRPPGVGLDGGGLAKGMFADALGRRLAGHASFAVDCGGDLLLGGGAGARRQVRVQSPFDGRTLHTFELACGGVATSGISKRCWLDAEGRPCHHLLDPASGRAAFTGVVQVTALAATALEAEVRAKAAVLSGPRGARRWLARGGLAVFDDGSHELVAPPPAVSVARLARTAGPRRLAAAAG